jgi:hypothetical protein
MKKPVIALLLLASSAAFANEAGDELANRTPFAGERSRAEVQAEVANARSAGTLGINEYALNMPQALQSGRSRGDLRAEAVQAARVRVIHELI